MACPSVIINELSSSASLHGVFSTSPIHLALMDLLFCFDLLSATEQLGGRQNLVAAIRGRGTLHIFMLFN